MAKTKGKMKGKQKPKPKKPTAPPSNEFTAIVKASYGRGRNVEVPVTINFDNADVGTFVKNDLDVAAFDGFRQIEPTLKVTNAGDLVKAFKAYDKVKAKSETSNEEIDDASHTVDDDDDDDDEPAPEDDDGEISEDVD